MCDAGCKVELGCFVFVLLTVPVYITVINVLLKKRYQRAFKGPFYRIAVVTGVVDLICITNFYLFYRTSVRGIFDDLHAFGGEALYRFWVFFVFGGNKCQVLLVFATTVNRYTSITKPHLKAWSPSYTKRVLVACIAVSYGSCLNIGFCDVLSTNKSVSGVAMAYPSTCWLYSVVSGGLVTFVVCVILFFLYGRMMWIICRRAKAAAAKGQGNVAKKERTSWNVFIIATVLSALVECQLVQAIVAAALPEVYQSEFHQALTLIYTVLFGMCNPILLLVCSADVRKAFCNTLGCKTDNKTKPSKLSAPKPPAATTPR